MNMTKAKMSPDLEAALPPMAATNRHEVSQESLPHANYNILSERLRQSAPSDFQCAVFCGGRKCKYESANHWNPEDMAISGVFSHWVTDDVLAMSRPNTEMMRAYSLIESFHDYGIKSIINLQEPGEHSNCGNPLSSSGFSYDPSLFMDNDDMVKVMTFALSEGKVAIHCHAGLGRTGVLIASYLVYTWRCRPQDAIRYVRSKRVPKQQLLSLAQHLKRQRYLLHGFESRHLRYIPKLIFAICERLLKLCNRHKTYSPGIVRNASIDGNEAMINFQVTNSESFCTYFFSSAASGAEALPESRPQSNMTIQLSSGFVSPETALTDLSSSEDSRAGTAESKDSKCSEVVNAKNLPIGPTGPLASCSGANSTTFPAFHQHHHHYQQQFINSLPPVEESADSSPTMFPELDYINSPMMQIGLVGLDTPKRTSRGSPSQLDSDDPSSPSDSLTSLIEKTLGYRIMHVSTPPVVYSRELEVEQQQQQNSAVLNSGDSNATDYSNFEEALARSGLVSHVFNQGFEEGDDRSVGNPCSSGFVSGCGTNGTEEDYTDSPLDPALIARGLMGEYRMYSPDFIAFLKLYQRDLNTRASAWDRLSQENNVELLCALLWSWLENLREPIFNRQALTYIVLKAEKPIDALIKLEMGSRYTCEYLVRFFARLKPEPEEVLDILLKRLIGCLSHQSIKIDTKGSLVPTGVPWSEMRKGTTGRVILFVKELYALLHRP